MSTRVCCSFCAVWIDESESRLMNEFDGFSTNMFPGDDRCCQDEHACVRRKKDEVGIKDLKVS